jgi:hypothetical protein
MERFRLNTVTFKPMDIQALVHANGIVIMANDDRERQ